MRFSTILAPVAFLPLALANPAAAPAPVAVAAPAPVAALSPELAQFMHLMEKRATALEERQIDLGGLLGNLTGSLGAVVQLLNPEVIGAIGPLLGNANKLLQPPFVDQTRDLIGDVAPVSFRFSVACVEVPGLLTVGFSSSLLWLSSSALCSAPSSVSHLREVLTSS